jgi:integrase
MAKLTAGRIKDIRPQNKEFHIWDDEIKGFGCRISPKGKIGYVFHYRLPGSLKSCAVKIGSHGQISIDEARKTAKLWSADILKGIDPKSYKQELKQKIPESKPTIENLLFSEFLNIFEEKYMLLEYSVGSLNTNRSRIKVHILPFFGKMKLKEIQSKNIRDFLNSSNEGKENRSTCIKLISAIFNKAIEWEFLPQDAINPCKGVKLIPLRKMQNFLREHELRKLEDALSRREEKNPYTVLALRLLLYTGARKNEILKLKWENIQFENNFIYLKEHKTMKRSGARTIPLNARALEALKKVKRQFNNPYVFCGQKENQHLKNIDNLWRRVKNEIGLENFRIHDIRHSFASFAIKGGASITTVAGLLGHADIKTTMRYVHLENEFLQKESNKVAEIFA